MGKRIYNAESGVLSPNADIREFNIRENAAVRAGLLPEIRARYDRADALRAHQLKTKSFALIDGTPTDFGSWDHTLGTEEKQSERRADRQYGESVSH